jgi:hypothetical protein
VLSEFWLTNTLYDSAKVAPGIIRATVGNPSLRPERTSEWEFGFDLSLFAQERIQINMTSYRKLSLDAIMDATLSPSHGADMLTQQRNVGSVQNKGIELSTSAKVFNTRMFGWDISVSVSRNANMLVKKDSTTSESTYGGRLREGYPIFGLWAYPLLSYNDLNGDGMLAVSEAAFGDSLMFYSAPYPRSEINYQNTITLLNGAVRVSSLVSQTNGLGTIFTGGSATRCEVDRTCTIAQQAAAMARANGATLPVNTTRLQEVSVTYMLSPRLARTLFRTRSGSISLGGRNLALWSNYSGKDPNINKDNSDVATDDGATLPQPRSWSFRFNLGF